MSDAAAPSRRRRSLRPNVTHVDFWQRHRDDAYDLVAGLRNGSYMGEQAQREVAAQGQAFAAKFTFEPARWARGGGRGAAAAACWAAARLQLRACPAPAAHGSAGLALPNVWWCPSRAPEACAAAARRLARRYLYWRRAIKEYKSLFPDMDEYIERWVAGYCSGSNASSRAHSSGPDFCERIKQPLRPGLPDP